MAGDWIKMRVGLTTTPRVMRIAECLVDDAEFLEWAGLGYGVPNYPPAPEADMRAERHAALRVTRYVTVTALLRWWGYANEHAKGEFIAGVFPEDVDEITGVPGFARAIAAAGWVQFRPDGGVDLPNFSEHNTSAGERSSGAERQKRYREKSRQVGPESDKKSDVTRDVTVTPREEKRREEEKQKSPPAAAEFDFKAELFARWKSLPGSGGGAFLNKLFKDHKPEQRVVEAVESTLAETRADPKAFVLGVLAKGADPTDKWRDDPDSAPWAGALR